LYNKYTWRCHNDEWPNYARNAIKGSCNVYFSRLADRIEPLVLQQWLFALGYGHISPLVPAFGEVSLYSGQAGDGARDLRQAAGQISTMPARLAEDGESRRAQSTISSGASHPQADFEPAFGEVSPNGGQLPPLTRGERRFFGIGQGNLRATPLQAANAMAAIARGGVYKPPRLFLTPEVTKDEKVLGISARTLSVVREGMYAVVNEPGGTAYNEFASSGFAEQDIKVYGKTGSTEEPDNAWFCGFAEDSTGKKIAIAVTVEGGQHGASDAGPLARDIIQLCIETGYIGKPNIHSE
jgi:cell division protein FtsI/penicillin-binding protein 2